MIQRLLSLMLFMSLSASIYGMGMMPRGQIKTDETKILTDTTSTKIDTTSQEVSTKSVQVELQDEEKLKTETILDAATEPMKADTLAR